MRIVRLILISLGVLLIAFNVLYLFELISGRYRPEAYAQYRYTIYAAPVFFLLVAWLLLYIAARLNKKMKRKASRQLVQSLVE